MLLMPNHCAFVRTYSVSVYNMQYTVYILYIIRPWVSLAVFYLQQPGTGDVGGGQGGGGALRLGHR